MSRSVFASLLCAVMAVAVLAPHRAGAQRSTAAVSLTATLHPQATIEHRTAPLVRQRLGDTTEYSVTLSVRANTTYRIVARRGADTATSVSFTVPGHSPARLDGSRRAIQIARGDVGLTTFEVRYAITSDATALVAFEVMLDTARPHDRD